MTLFHIKIGYYTKKNKPYPERFDDTGRLAAVVEKEKYHTYENCYHAQRNGF